MFDAIATVHGSFPGLAVPILLGVAGLLAGCVLPFGRTVEFSEMTLEEQGSQGVAGFGLVMALVIYLMTFYESDGMTFIPLYEIANRDIILAGFTLLFLYFGAGLFLAMGLRTLTKTA